MIGCTRIACCTQMKKLGAPVQQCQESVWSPDRNKDANTKCLNHSKTREDVAITCCNFNNGKKRNCLVSGQCCNQWNATAAPWGRSGKLVTSLRSSAAFKTEKIQHLEQILISKSREKVETVSPHSDLIPTAFIVQLWCHLHPNGQQTRSHRSISDWWWCISSNAALSRRPWGVYADCHLFQHDLYLTEPEPEVVVRIWF